MHLTQENRLLGELRVRNKKKSCCIQFRETTKTKKNHVVSSFAKPQGQKTHFIIFLESEFTKSPPDALVIYNDTTGLSAEISELTVRSQKKSW